ncbi:MAG TPA: hypothetical protein VLF43_01470 [Candidatus Saccharimonadales bacterium]|nr:hypothetical protein [Candidatus Saccharimonadales bacterium]
MNEAFSQDQPIEPLKIIAAYSPEMTAIRNRLNEDLGALRHKLILLDGQPQRATLTTDETGTVDSVHLSPYPEDDSEASYARAARHMLSTIDPSLTSEDHTLTIHYNNQAPTRRMTTSPLEEQKPRVTMTWSVQGGETNAQTSLSFYDNGYIEHNATASPEAIPEIRPATLTDMQAGKAALQDNLQRYGIKL